MNKQDKDHKRFSQISKLILTKMYVKIAFVVVVVVMIIGMIFAAKTFLGRKSKPEILTVSNLEKVINISELSTFQAVYNGVAKSLNEKNPEIIDYYVSYEAKVYAGFDFEKIEIKIDDEMKKIIITLPEIKITDVNVDIASLDYIFQNKKANISGISEEAYKLCKEDVTKESSKVAEIYELAEQNAKNIMKALIDPFIKQLEYEYELEIN